MTLREMGVSELARIAEIDRSERITQQYKSRGGSLELIDVDIRAPRWGEPGEQPVRYYVDAWKPLLEKGGVLLGELDGDRLVGFAIVDPLWSQDSAFFAALYVSRPHRGRGIGRRLADEVARLARAAGAKRLYVSATPTRSTVDFYRQQGFEPLAVPDAMLFALEPDDIHMELEL
jgi:GNAT superfamily N-acetyltransferase